ncbi:Hypothetical predicted protein [Mytilus galloprovincialis]|uniref:Uncharacterized protein n=1 Tax=Mytilus galloprovincialis TaxID=29158 RepID=A0A8B6BYD8_MYTGA|nr:Hypothetical predicted protein [Mytilus galloprovincialis]
MACLVMILINALVVCVVKADMNMKFGYHVIEGNARYLENIETNLAENTIKIHTPAHNDVMESYIIQDFRQGQQMKCLPSVKQCRLRDIDRATAGDAGQVTEGFIHSWNKGDNTINSDNEEVVKEMYYINLDGVINDHSLEGHLKEYYQDFRYPIYQEKKIPENAKLLNITRSAGGRMKRSLTSLTRCNGETPIFALGMDSGRNCNHLKICREVGTRNNRKILTDCNDTHITSPMVYQCSICPGVTSIDMKDPNNRCIKMNNFYN